MSRACIVLLALALLVPAASDAAGSSGMLVNQVYGGGGNSGATYQDDYVELLNAGATSVDLSGYTLQYATASGTSWQAVALTGTLAAGHYYLVRLASGGTAGAALPTPDATGSVNLATTGGKIALVHGTAPLTCGATAGSCAGAAVDLVGYGTATDFESSAAPALDSTHAALRTGCTDTNDNGADFTAGAPSPRTTASAPACDVAGSGGTTSSASVSADVQAVLSVSLDQPVLSFGPVLAGATPARLAERVTVLSTLASGYSLSAHRTAFTPADLPLGLAAVAPAGAALGALLSGGALAALPIAPATDLLVGTTAAASPASGDAWSTQIGFTGPIPAVPAGRYQASVVFTVVAR